MLTGEIRSQIDQIWNAFWSGGISNPLEVIEQITYLLFLKRLDEQEIAEELKANREKKPMQKRFFPEGKDVTPGTPRLREQLLKLPACASHNTALSEDDEYAAYLVASSVTSNGVGQQQAATKVLRAVRRRPKLAGIFMKNPRRVRA